MLALTGAAAALPLVPPFAGSAGAWPRDGRHHAITVFGAPKHGPDFTHFDYANPDAPKGGEMRLIPSSFGWNQNPNTFDTFNTYILRGSSPPLTQLIHASLMVRGLDEPDAVYPLVAEAVEVDGRRFAFILRPEATFTDGSPVTAEDVVFTLETLREDGHPNIARPLRDVASVEAADARTAVITFAESASNRLPPLVATYPILSKAYYTEKDFTEADLDIPVSSGAYTIGDHDAGRFVSFRLRDDWWGDDVPAARGHNNFQTVRVNFYRERITSFEAFKVGDVTYREEFVSRSWATEYNFPAIEDGRVVRRVFPDDRPAGAQGWFINTRRGKFADPRTREALGYAFDFEWTNENLFYGLYERTPSFFVNSDMMATGEPSEAERALLEPFRGEVPDTVFGPAWTPPVTDGTGRDRTPLRRANELLTEAGWQRTDDGLVNGDGERLTVEFLYNQPTFERIIQPYASRLRLLGIEASLRIVDASQYQRRLDTFDFDLTTRRFVISSTPTDIIRQYWTSETADLQGSFNMAGIKDPAIDALTETMLAARTREEMVTAARALDRVLRSGYYWVPQWYKGTHTVAYWDRFGFPETKPRYGFPVTTTWWAKDA
jgi:microcin C transport system substrate-binding protein